MHLLLPRNLAALMAGLTAPAFAQQAATEPGMAQVEVLGGAAAYDPHRDDTASKFVIGREEIERYGNASVFDVFKRIPGVTVTTGSGRSTEVRQPGAPRGGPVRVAGNRGFYSHTRTDLDTYAAWKFNPKVQLRVAITNLLSEDNHFEASNADPASGVEKRGFVYPEARSCASRWR